MDETRAAVRVMQDYITEHISEEITIDDLIAEMDEVKQKSK